MAIVKEECRRCGGPTRPGESVCEGCAGGFVRAVRRPRVRAEAYPGAQPFHAPHEIPVVERPARGPLGLPEHWFYLICGALLAPVFTFTPILQYMGWFLASLVHEMGHAIVAWFCGCPAVPAIRLDGHAWATHQSQVMFLALVVWGGLGFLTWQQRHNKTLLIALGIATLTYPAIAFTGARDALFLLAGQSGEMAFAAICLWRAITGTFQCRQALDQKHRTESRAERIAYGAAGWFLLGKNIHLAGGLVFSESVRAWYQSSGSLGMENDYLRLARAWGMSIESVGTLMLLVALAIFPTVWWVTRSVRSAPIDARCS